MRNRGSIVMPREHQVVFVRWRVTEGAAKVHEQIYLRPGRAWSKVMQLQKRGVAEVCIFEATVSGWKEHRVDG